MKHSDSSSLRPASRSTFAKSVITSRNTSFSAPLLKAAVHHFVVRIGLRQHVPLGAGIENPQRRLERAPRSNRLAPRTIGGDVLLGKVLPKAFPPRISQGNHASNSTPALCVS